MVDTVKSRKRREVNKRLGVAVASEKNGRPVGFLFVHHGEDGRSTTFPLTGIKLVRHACDFKAIRKKKNDRVWAEIMANKSGNPCDYQAIAQWNPAVRRWVPM